jgi:hypothetical protein
MVLKHIVHLFTVFSSLDSITLYTLVGNPPPPPHILSEVISIQANVYMTSTGVYVRAFVLSVRPRVRT